MPVTLKPLQRIEILDELLSSTRFTGPELLKRVNEKLLDLYDLTIDKRTLSRDLNFLEFKKLAPLHRPVTGDMFYYYSEKFSLKNSLIDSDELRVLKQAINIFKKVQNFQLNTELDFIIGKLENRIHTNVPDVQTIVHFEDHTQARGNDWFHELFDAIREFTPLSIKYHSFKETIPREYVVHPYLLKEYRNRWFLIGRDGDSARILTLGLDRIKGLKISKEKFIKNNVFEPDALFDNIIGVSMDYNRKPENIVIKIHPVSAPHVESKPLHKNQELLKKQKNGSLIIKLHLIVNYELKATLLGFGEGLEVISPVWLRADIKKSLSNTQRLYKKRQKMS